MNLQGCFTALVTPFRNGEVAFDEIEQLVEAQIAGGVDGIVPMGTTGESPTLDFKEHAKVIDTVIKAANGRCKIIAGTGANSTQEAVELTRSAAEAGADATLQVTPYYNKPMQEGLYLHFKEVADKGGLPVILYNVPGRSGVPIDIETIVRLAENPNIVAVKEAGGSVDRVSQIKNACEITVLSGDDSLTIPMMSVGAEGVISVTSNLLPKEITEIVHAGLEGNWQKAKELHFKYYDLFTTMFVETNPIPVKVAMAMAGVINSEDCRLPLSPIAESSREILRQSLTNAGVKLIK